MTEGPTAEPGSAVGTTQPAEPPKESAPLTSYMVLSKDADQDWWIIHTKRDARSAKAAITDYVKEKELSVGTFVAVPARSWAPVELKIETRQQISLK